MINSINERVELPKNLLRLKATVDTVYELDTEITEEKVNELTQTLQSNLNGAILHPSGQNSVRQTIFNLSVIRVPLPELRLVIERDDFPINPRKDYEPLCFMVYNHPRYVLGDLQCSNVLSWVEENVQKGGIFRPYYLYDHSGLSLSLQPFPCPWDSGQVGFIVMQKDVIEENSPPFASDTERQEWVESVMESEIRIFDQYLNNEVWAFKAFRDNEFTEDEELIDSCYGFYGITLEETGLRDAVPKEFAGLLEQAWDERG